MIVPPPSQSHGQNPPLSSPPNLPITAHRDKIIRLLRRHQVVVVCGETGCGKSTQLAKFCLAAGCGAAGMIGHTQPRRIAARAVAARVAEELGSPLGGMVGYRVRFAARVSDKTRIKVMTDGVLLSEMETDPQLGAYGALIIDEAHERSLNIDFLLGCLKRLLPARPQLRLIITSATINPRRFAAHFDGAPMVEVSGRMYPVEVRHRPPPAPDSGLNHLAAVVAEACDCGAGDVLVFLPGEREIREARDHLARHGPRGAELLPLYARLPLAAQRKVFRRSEQRRIILATNVAETSLTVPGIRFVVDGGQVRISRYSSGRKLQRLPVERVSRASAGQRAGRCGRVADGVCFRLYGEEDFASRAEFTDPEILRTSLAGVILRLKAGGLGAVEEFPFLDAPDKKQINDGYKLLQELQAVDGGGGLTPTGRRMAQLPLDPRAARMVLAAAGLGCLRPALVVVAGLSVNDPRITVDEHRDATLAAHKQFTDPASDFLSMLMLWRFFHRRTRGMTERKARIFCGKNFLSWRRMREWQDVHRQLRALVREMKIGGGSGAGGDDAGALHRALLCGLLGNIGMRGEDGEYEGPRGLRWRLFPGSALVARPPKWVMAVELVETRRLYARMAAPLKPQWVEQLAPQLVARNLSEPYWDASRGRVMGCERVSLYGLTLCARRRVDFGALRPAEAREIFIRDALVGDKLPDGGDFHRANRALINQVRELEIRARRRDLLVSDHALFNFYDRRLPADVCTARGLRDWRDAGQKLHMSLADITTALFERFRPRDYPAALATAAGDIALSYRFEPGREGDGLTARVPLPLLNQLRAADFDALVPGLLEEKVTALLRSLPKELRRKLGPAPNRARECLAQLADTGKSPLCARLAEILRRLGGVTVSAGDFDEQKLDPHLRMKFAVVDETGNTVGGGENLGELQKQFGTAAAGSFAAEAGGLWEGAREMTAWHSGEIPRTVCVRRAGREVTAWPALEDRGDRVAPRLFDTEQAACAAQRGAVRRLLLLEDALARRLRRQFPQREKLARLYAGVGRAEDLFADLGEAVLRDVFLRENDLPRTPEAFRELRARGAEKLGPACAELALRVAAALEQYRATRAVLGQSDFRGREVLRDEVREQLAHLVYAGFAGRTSVDNLAHLPRYLQAVTVRLRRAQNSWDKDRRCAGEINPYWRRYLEVARGARSDAERAFIVRYRWMLEEWRVSLFAQELRTAYPVSCKRVHALWEEVTAEIDFARRS